MKLFKVISGLNNFRKILVMEFSRLRIFMFMYIDVKKTTYPQVNRNLDL